MRLGKAAKFIIPLAAIALCVVAFLFLADPLFDLDFGFIVEKTSAGSDIVALVGRDLMQLNTVEAVYKMVFPYDFVPRQIDWRLFLAQVESGRPLTEEEAAYHEVYTLAREIGIDPASNRNEFVVVTAVAKIGLDLERFSQSRRSVANGTVGPVSLRSDGTVVISLPPVVITDLIISDSGRDDYDYPDLSVTPDGWRRISAFVSSEVSTRIEATGLFDEAKNGAMDFLEMFFREAGYPSVIFAE